MHIDSLSVWHNKNHYKNIKKCLRQINSNINSIIFKKYNY